MKQTIFTLDERILLQGILKLRLNYYGESFNEIESNDKATQRRFESFYIRPLESALSKILSSEETYYKTSELAKLVSCINEHIEDYRREQNLETALSVNSKLEISESILSKCGYYKRKHFLS